MQCSAKGLLKGTANHLCRAIARAPRRSFRRCTHLSSASKDLPPPDVQHLAQLAHLSVTEQEVKDWEPKINSILEWFGQLQDVDVSGVEPALRADINADNVLRDDVAVECESREELMAGVPEKENAYVKVPKIM